MNTIDGILQDFEERVKADMPISAQEWLHGAVELNALKGTLDNEIINLECEYLKIKASKVEADIPNAKAESLAKATDTYKQYRLLKAKADRISQFIMTAKQISRLNEF